MKGYECELDFREFTAVIRNHSISTWTTLEEGGESPLPTTEIFTPICLTRVTVEFTSYHSRTDSTKYLKNFPDQSTPLLWKLIPSLILLNHTWSLAQTAPAETVIPFELEKSVRLTLSLYSSTGILQKELFTARFFSPGKHRITLPLYTYTRGFYYYILTPESGTPQVRKLIISK